MRGLEGLHAEGRGRVGEFASGRGGLKVFVGLEVEAFFDGVGVEPIDGDDGGALALEHALHIGDALGEVAVFDGGFGVFEASDNAGGGFWEVDDGDGVLVAGLEAFVEECEGIVEEFWFCWGGKVVLGDGEAGVAEEESCVDDWEIACGLSGGVDALCFCGVEGLAGGLFGKVEGLEKDPVIADPCFEAGDGGSGMDGIGGGDAEDVEVTVGVLEGLRGLEGSENGGLVFLGFFLLGIGEEGGSAGDGEVSEGDDGAVVGSADGGLADAWKVSQLLFVEPFALLDGLWEDHTGVLEGLDMFGEFSEVDFAVEGYAKGGGDGIGGLFGGEALAIGSPVGIEGLEGIFGHNGGELSGEAVADLVFDLGPGACGGSGGGDSEGLCGGVCGGGLSFGGLSGGEEILVAFPELVDVFVGDSFADFEEGDADVFDFEAVGVAIADAELVGFGVGVFVFLEELIDLLGGWRCDFGLEIGGLEFDEFEGDFLFFFGDEVDSHGRGDFDGIGHGDVGLEDAEPVAQNDAAEVGVIGRQAGNGLDVAFEFVIWDADVHSIGFLEEEEEGQGIELV